MFQIKPDVDVRGVKPEIVLAILAAYDVIGGARGDGCTITSGMEGKHGPDSKHYDGYAVDIRTRHLDPIIQDEVTMTLSRRLGAQYDVVLEKTHIHIEFDPRGDI